MLHHLLNQVMMNNKLYKLFGYIPNAYQTYYPGNLNPDGITTKYNEAEYTQVVDGYSRKFEAIGITRI